MMRRIAAITAVVLAAGCTDTEPEPDSEPGISDLPGAEAPAQPGQPALPPDDGDLGTVNVTLTEWGVELSQDSVAAGAVAFNVGNTGTMRHRFEVEGNGEEWVTDDVAAGGDVTMSLNLSPGTYELYCPIEDEGGSHRARGMTATLRVY